VAYAQNPHKVPGNPIADDVRINQRPLAQIGARNRTTALRKGFQAVAGRDQLMYEVRGSATVKPRDVAVDVTSADGDQTTRTAEA
jgi:hypothetical protein